MTCFRSKSAVQHMHFRVHVNLMHHACHDIGFVKHQRHAPSPPIAGDAPCQREKIAFHTESLRGEAHALAGTVVVAQPRFELADASLQLGRRQRS